MADNGGLCPVCHREAVKKAHDEGCSAVSAQWKPASKRRSMRYVVYDSARVIMRVRRGITQAEWENACRAMEDRP